MDLWSNIIDRLLVIGRVLHATYALHLECFLQTATPSGTSSCVSKYAMSQVYISMQMAHGDKQAT